MTYLHLQGADKPTWIIKLLIWNTPGLVRSRPNYCTGTERDFAVPVCVLTLSLLLPTLGRLFQEDNHAVMGQTFPSINIFLLVWPGISFGFQKRILHH